MTVIGERQRAAAGGPRLDTRALVVFFVLAYALSWSWVIPLAAAHEVVRRGAGWPTHLPGAARPGDRGGGGDRLDDGPPGGAGPGGPDGPVAGPVRWWLAAVSPLVFLGLGLAAMAAAGKGLPAAGEFGRFSGIPAIGLAGVLLVIFVAALGEETGWRGYALPQLQRRFSPLASSLILAVLWFAWHLPQFLVIATYRDFPPAGYVGMFCGLACGAVVLTWLYNRSGGSILLVAVWHGLYNVVSGTQAATGILAAVVSTLIMIQAIVLIVLEMRARRRGRPSVLGPP